MSEATPILLSHPSYPLAPFDTPSKSAERRAELLLIAEEVVGAAVLAGWRRPRRRVYSRGHSIYVTMKLGGKRRVLVRISDHAPSRPMGGEGELPTLMVTLDVPGNISNAVRWLEQTAEQHREQAAENQAISEGRVAEAA